MRGSLKRQIGVALDAITRIGESKILARKNGQQHYYIHSITTRSATGAALRPLVDFCTARSIKDIEKLSVGDLRDYIEVRLAHHIAMQNTLKTLQSELAVIARFERGMTAFNQAQRDGNKTFDLSSERSAASRLAVDELPRRASPLNRAYIDPQDLVGAIKNPIHQLQARLQLEGGCRAEGIGAPAQAKFNPITRKNFRHHQTGEALGKVKDPLTGEIKAAFWSIEKGGKLAYHYCSVDTFQAVSSHVQLHGKLESNYREYLASIEEAARATNQYSKGLGTHGLRFNFGQRRYDQAIRAGYSDEQAKVAVSVEMSHNRADVTETYLK